MGDMMTVILTLNGDVYTMGEINRLIGGYKEDSFYKI